MWWFAVLACGGDADPDQVPAEVGETGATGSTADTGTTNPFPTYFDAVDIFVSAQVGWDAAAGELGVVERINGTFEFPLIEVILALETWDGDLQNTAEYCSVLIVFEDSTEPPWVTKDPRLIWGVDWRDKDLPVTTCVAPNYALDPFVWGLDVMVTLTNGGGWGVAIGDLDPAAEKVLAAALGTDMQYVVGGAFGLPPFLPGDRDDAVYAYGWQTDADLQLVDAEGDNLLDPMLATDIHDGVSLATGWYTLFTLSYWSVD